MASNGRRRRKFSHIAQAANRAHLDRMHARNLAPAQTLPCEAGTISRAGERARIISFRSSRCAPCARSKVASRRPRSRTIIQGTAATTTSSVSGRCARSAGIATKAYGPSISAATAWPLATTACRSIRRIRSIGHGSRAGLRHRAPPIRSSIAAHRAPVVCAELRSTSSPAPSLRYIRPMAPGGGALSSGV
jgi:hypothetical protein